MGLYINTGNAGFRSARRGEYVDKSGLIRVMNATLGTEFRFSCVTRARRFGKSMAAKMLCAYYDQSCDSRELFADLEIAGDPTFEEHLNKYPVIYVDMTSFVGRFHGDDIVERIEEELRRDVPVAFPDVAVDKRDDLMDVLVRIAEQTDRQFVFIIDEWDAICREFPRESVAMDRYVSWLRRMFKSVSASRAFAVVYMTGILPIKKYNTQSALNNFREYSMLIPRKLASYYGFTRDEVRRLAEKHQMDFDELQKWYDGYQIGSELSMFNPNSVIEALSNEWCESYWGTTGAFTAVTDYILMNFEGLKDNIIAMLGGERVKVETTMFSNDMRDVRSRDDVLTLLIHLGYLSYDRNSHECYIPNREVATEMENAVKAVKWKNVVDALQQSERLMQALLCGDGDAVARGVEAVHSDSTSILSYNDENSLACVISLAFYAARNDYHIHREYQTGSGFADLVLIPRKNVALPAVVIELKYGETAQTALMQIKDRHYPEKVSEYTGDLLLCGISYDRQSKQHTCQIEKVKKELHT